MKTITLKDVAKKVGVSTATVSLILNDPECRVSISQKTRENVLAAVKELNYTPNLLAKGLRRQKTFTIGLILSDISSIFYAHLAQSIQTHANERGYDVIFCSSGESAEKEKKQIEILKERRVDGLIISSTQKNPEDILQLKNEKYPFVLIDRFYPRIKTDYVISDSQGGAKTAVEYLLSQGHQKIGCVTSSPHVKTVQLRVEGYKDALRNRGVPMKKRFIKNVPVPDKHQEIKVALRDLLYPPNSVTSIFTIAYTLTLYVLAALKNMNLRIPYDFSLVSFDDGDILEYSSIPAIRQPIGRMGEQAVELLVNQIECSDTNRKPRGIILPVEFVGR